MAGTRTAPTIEAASITGHDFTVRMMDWNGDKRSISLQFVGPTPPAEVNLETYVAALQAITNSTIYEARLTALYSGPVSTANADNALRVSVYDNVVVSFKDQAARDQFSAYVPAPVAVILDQTEQVDNTNVAYVTWRNAVGALFGTYTPDRARFTERIERNPAGPA